MREGVRVRGRLARIGVRFGGSLASAQAERLRAKGEGELSEAAALLASASAARCEGVASAIGDLDRDLAARGAGARAPALPPAADAR